LFSNGPPTLQAYKRVNRFRLLHLLLGAFNVFNNLGRLLVAQRLKAIPNVFNSLGFGTVPWQNGVAERWVGSCGYELPTM